MTNTPQTSNPTLASNPLNILIKKENNMDKPTKIEVEDFGASIAEEIVKISSAMKNTRLTDRAIAVLIRDKVSIGLTDAQNVLNAIRKLDRYVK